MFPITFWLMKIVRYFRKSELFPAYGPLHEDEINMEESEAKKMASARKRLMSYKTEKLKSKLDEPAKENPFADNHNNMVTSHKTDGKILFVPTPDEIKEHPIFSSSSAVYGSNNTLKYENEFLEQGVSTKYLFRPVHFNLLKIIGIFK